MKRLFSALGLVYLSIALIHTALWRLPASAQGYEDAKRINAGTYVETWQVTVATSGSSATSIVPADVKRPCVCVKNISKNFDVGIGSNTSTLLTTGYVLNVSTSPASELCLNSFTEAIYGYGAGTGTSQPTVAAWECQVR